MRRRFLGMAATLLVCGLRPAVAQQYPNRVVKILNPFPGGPTDNFARLVAAKLQTRLGQPFIVDGKAGAGGVIGVSAAARAPADGYTLLVTSASTQIVQPVVRRSLPYDAEKDFIPLLSPGAGAPVVVVNPSLQINSLQQLIDYARAHPGKVSFGSSGMGTALHLAGEVFAQEAGVKLLHVPYKTAAQASTDLLGGQVNVMFDSLTNSGPHIKSGKLVGLAVMGSERERAFPDIKSTAELGFPKMLFSNWLGVYAIAGTPSAIVDQLIGALKESVNDDDFKAFMVAASMQFKPIFGSDFAQDSRNQRQALASVVKSVGIPLID